MSRRQAAKDTSANEEECDMTFDHIDMDHSCPPQPRQKVFKDQRNQSRKQTDRAQKQLTDQPGEEEESEGSFISPQSGIEVDVEINIIDNSYGHKTPSHPVKHCSKRKATTPQRVRSKPRADTAAAVPLPGPGEDTAASSPSHASIISETAAEELCDLRNYYNKQLRRINHISHEYLGQPSEPGMLSCIREPLRSLRLPRRGSIAQTARSLWTRVSGRRKLVHR